MSVKIICLGALGGSKSSDLTSFVLEWSSTGAAQKPYRILLDAGCIVPNQYNYSTINTIFLSHSHLDHIAGLLGKNLGDYFNTNRLTIISDHFLNLLNESVLVEPPDNPEIFKMSVPPNIISPEDDLDTFKTHFHDKQHDKHVPSLILKQADFKLEVTAFPLHHYKYYNNTIYNNDDVLSMNMIDCCSSPRQEQQQQFEDHEQTSPRSLTRKWSSSRLLVSPTSKQTRRLSHFDAFNSKNNTCRSHAYILQASNYPIIVFFGDFTTSILEDPETNKQIDDSDPNYTKKITELRQNEVKRIVNELRTKIPRGYISILFLECAFKNNTPDIELYGHMKPAYLVEVLQEMHKHLLISPDQTLLIINHMKPSLQVKSDQIYYNYTPVQDIRSEIQSYEIHRKYCKYVFCDQFDTYSSTKRKNSLNNNCFSSLCSSPPSIPRNLVKNILRKNTRIQNTRYESAMDILKPTLFYIDIKKRIIEIEPTINVVNDLIPLVILFPSLYDRGFKIITRNSRHLDIMKELCNGTLWSDFFVTPHLSNNFLLLTD